MSDLKTYVYSCIRRHYEDRDVAHQHQVDPEELTAADTPVGAVAQVKVKLTPEGYDAYTDRSRVGNLLHIEEEAQASVAGSMIARELAEDEFATADGVRLIPTTEDTKYARSYFYRDRKLTGKGVRVAVLDTAMGAAVARWLRPQIAASRSFVGGDPLGGVHDHGTHVACLALPDDATLLMGEVLGRDGNGNSGGIIQAIYWAVDAGANIINMSLSGSGGLEQYRPAIQYANERNCLVVAAGGNEALKGNPRRYPAGVPGVVAVGAFDRRSDAKAPFASYHDYIKLVNSGVEVWSYLASGNMGAFSGSSQASPLTVWAIASELERFSDKRAAIRRVIQSFYSQARDTPAPATYDGFGVVDAYAAHKKLSKLHGR